MTTPPVKLTQYQADCILELEAQWPGWLFWIVPRQLEHGGDLWCARRELAEICEVQGDSPGHLSQHIGMKLDDEAEDAAAAERAAQAAQRRR